MNKSLGFCLWALLALSLPSVARAVVVTPASIVNVTNAPADSILVVECGPNTGVYTFTHEFPMGSGGTVPFRVGDILTSSGNYFCRARFATNFGGNYGVGPTSTEFNVTVNAQGGALSAPTFTVVP